MKITVINGSEKHGVTYRLKESFLEPFRDKAEITEFYLPKDCPGFCAGCLACFYGEEDKCKDAQYVQKIEAALGEADLLVFATPVYVYHITGALKTMLDHFGYRWMVHRPNKRMFGKRAVIITQCIGGGGASTVKDIRDSLSWWGVSYVKTCRFKLMSEVIWDKLPEKKRASMTESVKMMAERLQKIDYSRPARTGIVTKGKFYAVRMIQKNIGKTKPESADFRYWKENGWLDDKRPWRRDSRA